jgi:mannose-6-phosphate isomerase
MVDFHTESNSFQVLLCINGCGVIFGDNEVINFFKGDCIFVPANSIALKIHGKAQMLKISC